MSRVQLALNVDDIDAAVAFYSELFSAQPAKRRPGYANFAIDDPALKLVLIENPGSGGTLNHLGVEVASTEEVVAATRRLAKGGLPTQVEDGTTCCYALQDKVWATGPGRGALGGLHRARRRRRGAGGQDPRRRRRRPRRGDQQPRSRRRFGRRVDLLRRLSGPVPPTPPVARPGCVRRCSADVHSRPA